MQVRAVLVGDDFRFGHKQAGDTNMLAELGAQYGFEVDLITPVNVRGRAGQQQPGAADGARRESQSRMPAARPAVRSRRDRGQGHGVGAKQTVPTLNLQPHTEVWPADGVYVSRTHDLDSSRAWKSITNVGNRPTFDGHDTSIETFLLDPLTGPPSGAYSRAVSVAGGDERKFPTPAGSQGADPARRARGT